MTALFLVITFDVFDLMSSSTLIMYKVHMNYTSKAEIFFNLQLSYFSHISVKWPIWKHSILYIFPKLKLIQILFTWYVYPGFYYIFLLSTCFMCPDLEFMCSHWLVHLLACCNVSRWTLSYWDWALMSSFFIPDAM